MADLVADSFVWAGQAEGAQIGLVNVGGVRSDLPLLPPRYGEQSGEVTFAEAFDILPFGNVNVVLDLTGAQLKQVLEEQYQPVPARGTRPMLALGVSEGFTYAWDATQPQGSRVVPGSMELNGVADPDAHVVPGRDPELPRRRRGPVHDLHPGHQPGGLRRRPRELRRLPRGQPGPDGTGGPRVRPLTEPPAPLHDEGRCPGRIGQRQQRWPPFSVDLTLGCLRTGFAQMHVTSAPRLASVTSDVTWAAPACPSHREHAVSSWGRWDSNPHWHGPKPCASANWATAPRTPGDTRIVTTRW